MRVLAILERYPQLSETYISTDLRTLWPNRSGRDKEPAHTDSQRDPTKR